jgi:uncharacterized membrane protein YfcA
VPPSPDRGPVSALHRRLDRLPPRRRRAVVLLLLGALLAAVYLLTVWAQCLVGDDPVDWIQPLPGMLAAFTGSYVGMRVQRRRLGGGERMRQYDRAVRTGRLPDDADPAVWRPLLERELRVQQRAMRVSTGGVVLLCAVAWVLVAVLYDVGPVWWLVAAVVLVLVAAWLRWLGRRQAARIRRLLDRTPDTAPTGTAG